MFGRTKHIPVSSWIVNYVLYDVHNHTNVCIYTYIYLSISIQYVNISICTQTIYTVPVDVYIYTIYKCVYIYTHYRNRYNIHTYIYTIIYNMYTHACIHSSIHASVRPSIHPSIQHKYIHIYVRTYICTIQTIPQPHVSSLTHNGNEGIGILGSCASAGRLLTFDFDVIRISCITGADSSTAVTAWLFF